MALRKKQRSYRRKKRRAIRVKAYRQGKIDGYQQGKVEGFKQGSIAATEQKLQSQQAQQVQQEQQVTRGPDETVAQQVTREPDEAVAPMPIAYPAIDALVVLPSIRSTQDNAILLPLRALQQQGSFLYDVKHEHEVNEAMIEAATTVIFAGNVEPVAYELLEIAHQLNKRTVYVMNDNVLELEPNSPNGPYYAEPIRKETCIRFLKQAQIVKVETPELGSYIYEHFNSNIVSFQSSVDFEWLDQQERGERELGHIVIGCEGSCQNEDFTPVIPALNRILDYYGGFVKLEFIGYVPDALADHPNVTYKDKEMEYSLQQLKHSNWDIGLAPLRNNLYNRCKTINALREYGACRIPGIYSNSSVFSPWIVQGDNGYLVPHTEEGWYEGIQAMIEDPALRLRIREKNERVARKQFALDKGIRDWKRFILNN